MSLFDYLDKLREKPEAYRHSIVVLSTVLLMFFVVVLWVTFTNFLPNSEIETPKTDFSPFAVVKDTFLNLYNEIK